MEDSEVLLDLTENDVSRSETVVLIEDAEDSKVELTDAAGYVFDSEIDLEISVAVITKVCSV